MSDHVFDDDPRLDIYYDLVDYSKKNKGFDSKFLAGIDRCLCKNGRISIRQYRVLQEMYENIQL
jgi:hypothetical protein